MKKKTSTHYEEVLVILKQLNQMFPSYNMGRHLSTALDDYGDIWGLTDKEFIFALNKYKTQLELDEPHLTGEEELKEIFEDAMNLTISKEDDDLTEEQY